MFKSLPKTGHCSKPNNGRPIPVLKINCKFVAGSLLGRLALFLENELLADQRSFRPGLGMNEAMVVLENVCVFRFGLGLWRVGCQP